MNYTVQTVTVEPKKILKLIMRMIDIKNKLFCITLIKCITFINKKRSGLIYGKKVILSRVACSITLMIHH